MTEAWHFLPSNRCTRFTAEGPLEAGSVLRADPIKLNLCHYGLHASTDILDALRYAPGSIVCRVALRGKILHGEDKMCASEREILWIADATDVLRTFACECALRVIHLWDPPPVVREYLETGREDLRDTARGAALAVPRNLPWDGARNAAQDAAWGAAHWYADRYDVRNAARYAARYAMEAAGKPEREWQRARLEEMISALNRDT